MSETIDTLREPKCLECGLTESEAYEHARPDHTKQYIERMGFHHPRWEQPTQATFGEPGYDIVAGLRSDIKERYSDPIKYLAADEIERLTKAINDAIDYCYKFEREHEAGHPGMGALIPIQQDLQAAVGR